ncbi:hypothetical protein K438DRAFT_1816308 [Mycena galopus ATCC 62051]|nr:hypothetical protein K438DRAFT_1816308 [Mycena galopus ATCC 62051]
MTTLDTATIVFDRRINSYIDLAAISVLVYDHILTLQAEVAYVWTSGYTRTSAWYLPVRYFPLFTSVVVLPMYDFSDFDSKTCTKLNTAYQFLIVAQVLFVECTLIMRVICMYFFNKRIVLFLVTISIIEFSVAAWSAIPVGPIPVYTGSLPGCHVPTPHGPAMRLAGAWEGLLVVDVMLLGLTLHRGYIRSREAEVSLWRVIVRDGAMYFAIICLANLANILIYYLGDMYTAASLSAFTASISVTMICRLMLNLYEAAARPDGSNTMLDTVQ